MSEQKPGQKRIEKLRRRYKLVFMDADSYEEKLSVNLTRLGVMLVALLIIIIFTVINIYLIAFTPIREYIPGYADVELPAKLYELNRKTDSLENAFRVKDQFINNLKRIISDDSIVETRQQLVAESMTYDTLRMPVSVEDSLLRAEYEEQTKFNLYQNQIYNFVRPDLGNLNFFPPVKGIVTRSFNPALGHFGVDIVASKSEPIKALLDGTVIFSDWTLETGYIIGLQHKNNLISIYKHNSTLLKQQGTFVNVGETISIIGESGELSTGPHLHFEIWHNGKPIDPEGYISF